MENQTPKQKAAYLVALFESIAHPTIDCDKQFAKECAKRCIDEMIKHNPFSNNRSIEFWIEVKREIEKL